MAGYCGYSMSNNAVDAYNNGEKPISKWKKQDITYYGIKVLVPYGSSTCLCVPQFLGKN